MDNFLHSGIVILGPWVDSYKKSVLWKSASWNHQGVEINRVTEVVFWSSSIIILWKTSIIFWNDLQISQEYLQKMWTKTLLYMTGFKKVSNLKVMWNCQYLENLYRKSYWLYPTSIMPLAPWINHTLLDSKVSRMDIFVSHSVTFGHFGSHTITYDHMRSPHWISLRHLLCREITFSHKASHSVTLHPL